MLNSSEFHKLDYESIIAKAQSRDCTWYYFEFEKEKKTAQDSDNTENLDALTLFHQITSYIFNLGDSKKPLEHLISGVDKSGNKIGSGVPDQLNDQEIEYLSAVLEQIRDVELKSRIADILWIRKYKNETARPIDWAVSAIDLYIQSAQNLLEPDNWYESKQRYERAIQIALQIKNAGQEHLKNIVESIERNLSSYSGEDKAEVRAMFNRLLAEYRLFKIEDLDNLKADAQAAYSQLNFDLSQRIWKTVAEIYAQNGQDELKKEALITSAYCHVEKSKLRAQGNEFLAAFAILRDAINELIRLEQDKDEIEKLHLLLLEFQNSWVQNAPVVEFKSDSSALMSAFQQIRQQIKGKNALDAIITLALNFHFLHKESLSDTVSEHNKKFVLTQFARTFHTTKKGKVLNELMGDGARDSEASQHFFNSKLNQQAQFHFQVVGLALSAGAEQILEEHYLTEEDFFPIVQNNAFVPKGRERIFAKGLYHGLMGDYLLSSHLLIPQIENSFRIILEAADVPTSKLAIKQAQTENSFEKTITHPKMREMFSDDVIFTLLSLLSNVDSNGTNLRNELCHGLLDESQFISPYHIYAWGLVLRLCCDPFLQLVSLLHESQPERIAAEASMQEAESKSNHD